MSGRKNKKHVIPNTCGPGGGGGGGRHSLPCEGPRKRVGVPLWEPPGGVGVLLPLGGAGGGCRGLFEGGRCDELRLGVLPEKTISLSLNSTITFKQVNHFYDFVYKNHLQT